MSNGSVPTEGDAMGSIAPGKTRSRRSLAWLARREASAHFGATAILLFVVEALSSARKRI